MLHDTTATLLSTHRLRPLVGNEEESGIVEAVMTPELVPHSGLTVRQQHPHSANHVACCRDIDKRRIAIGDG